MKHYLLPLGRIVVTGLVILAAISCGRWLWVHYNVDPWTRDGRIRADVVQVTSDVSGLVTEVAVKDDQIVHPGQVLFTLDRPRFQLALNEAEAAISIAQASLAEAERETRRNRNLGDLVTTEQIQQGDSKVDELKAKLKQDLVQRDLARLNLERTSVVSKINGVATNVELQVGDYAATGRQVLALINTDSIHVDGYFEETKLPQIRVGDAALVHVMGVPTALHGHVVSIAAGIEDRERGASGDALPNVNPTFSWVRLAQRVPVRIVLDKVAPNVRLIAGRTVTVSILAPAHRPLEGARG